MRHILLGVLFIFSVLNISVVFGQTTPGKIFFEPVVLKKVGSGQYALSGSIDKDKHKETDPVPLSTISISASFYTYPKEGGAAPVLILPSIEYRKNDELTEEEKLSLLNNDTPPKGLFEDGKYFFLINNSQLNANTLYTVIVSFKGASGAVAEGTFRATTEKGVIPGTEESFINERSYRLLAPIPGMTLLLDPELCQAEQQANKAGQICDINAFINFLLSLAIGAAAVVLVVRIIISGYSYMTTDIPFLKAKTKGQFVEALVGLLVALSSYLILNTISPRLVSNDLKIGAVSFDIEEYPGDSDAYVPANYTQIQGTGVAGYNFDKAIFPTGVICPKSGGRARVREIAASWQGKATYSQVKRGTPGPNGTQYLDCSSYVTTVLLCAGIQPATYATTQAMFVGKAGSEKFSQSEVVESPGKIFIKGKELQPGDLLGWRNGNKGHVVIYVGGGKFRESQVGGYVVKNPILGKTGNSVQGEKSFSYYDGKLEYLRRIAP